MEYWVKHPIYNLLVSNQGRIKGPRGLRKYRTDRYGYYRINIKFQDKIITKTVHRLVADALIGVSKLTVNHKDGDKMNNHVENLELTTSEENTKHAFKSGLVKTCQEVCIGGEIYYSKREAERCTGIPRRHL